MRFGTSRYREREVPRSWEPLYDNVTRDHDARSMYKVLRRRSQDSRLSSYPYKDTLSRVGVRMHSRAVFAIRCLQIARRDHATTSIRSSSCGHSYPSTIVSIEGLLDYSFNYPGDHSSNRSTASSRPKRRSLRWIAPLSFERSAPSCCAWDCSARIYR